MNPMVRGGDGVRRVIRDGAWKQLEGILLQILSKRGAPPELSHREFLEAVLYLDRTGIPWRDLPVCFGDWNAVYQRYKRWRLNGTWTRLLAELQRPHLSQARKLMVDTTIVRAHQHAAGGGENKAEAKGRSRGGYTTKIHFLATSQRHVVALKVSEGQAGDAPGFDPLMQELNADECTADEVLADRAYDSNEIREHLADANFKVTIPGRSNRIIPIKYDEQSYKDRNQAESRQPTQTHAASSNKVRQTRRRFLHYGSSSRPSLTTFCDFVNRA